jgi:putative membrane protein
MISLADLPELNATLNGLSFLILMVGFYFIRSKKVAAHKACMLTALGVSTLFLISYLTYHFNVGSVRYTKQGFVRPIYFTILLTHTMLAITLVPMVAVTFVRALKERFDKHRKIAHWTLPIWVYVSVTGVVIYLMLYQL